MAGAAEEETRPLVGPPAKVAEGEARALVRARLPAKVAEGEPPPLVRARLPAKVTEEPLGHRRSRLTLGDDKAEGDLMERRTAFLSSPSPSVWPSSRQRIVDLNLLDSVQLDRFEEELNRAPSPSEVEAQDHHLVMECLHLYNLNHPENEYVPAPGKVTRHSSPHNGCFWTHGNFVASPKRSGCFSFLPARRTLFFYELVTKADFEGVVSCTPLEEPVTEAYSVLGVRLGWGTRRDGSSDCRCETCNRLVDRDVLFWGRAFPCGHDKAECVCQMCYLLSGVLHPLPEKFAFGNDD